MSLSALGLFGVIAHNLDDGTTLVEFDAHLADRLHEHAKSNPSAVVLLTGITALGSTKVLTTGRRCDRDAANGRRYGGIEIARSILNLEQIPSASREIASRLTHIFQRVLIDSLKVV